MIYIKIIQFVEMNVNMIHLMIQNYLLNVYAILNKKSVMKLKRVILLNQKKLVFLNQILV